MGGCREAEAFGHKEEFADKPETHKNRVPELHLMPPFFVKPKAVREEEKEGGNARADPHLQHRADIRGGRLDRELLQAQVKLSATQIRNARRSIGRRTAGVDRHGSKETGEKQKDAEV